MLRFLLGPVLLCAGYAAGNYYGADAEQLVHKSPSATYAGFEQAIDDVPLRGTTFFDGGTPVRYEIKIDRTLDQKLIASLWFAGHFGAEANIEFIPKDNGLSTLVISRIHTDRHVLAPALAGTSQARLAYAPDWMLNLTFRPVLRQLATQIDQGSMAHIDRITQSEAEAEWESHLSDQQRQHLAEWRQYDATRPTADPEADAQHYVDGGNGRAN